ncbi:hypothetical protein PghCCS26_59820 [Paenibacillus glycanilyticus]|uniref:Uncharacterized protein n=1 Tax=Paenibacillus glycanilyticus TaxID=126569 RepID=A0ABQ6NUS6_9BACL|nr:hypothetical protein PghCCS26_59820 [Paenibacillus glycanilyticus]
MDDLDKEIFIDFFECKNNWVNFANESDSFEGNHRSAESTNCVGFRDAFADPMYIEFCTVPRTRFVYPYRKNFIEKLRKLSSGKAYVLFKETNDLIEKYGWCTFDMG